MKTDTSHIDEKVSYARQKRIVQTGWALDDPLSLEIHKRHLQSLDGLNIQKGRALDLGSGSAASLDIKGVTPVNLDWVLQKNVQVVANARLLPFVDESFSLVWSNNTVQWISDPVIMMQECRRVLQNEGLFSFTSLGPDTLLSLDELLPSQKSRRLGFFDMHDLADMTMHNGFAEPVATCEYIVFEYSSRKNLVEELRRFGVLACSSMDKSLGETKRFQRALNEKGPVQITFEVIYIHAWAVTARIPKGPTWRPMSFDNAIK